MIDKFKEEFLKHWRVYAGFAILILGYYIVDGGSFTDAVKKADEEVKLPHEVEVQK